MIPKKIALIATRRATAQVHAATLRHIFGKAIQIHIHALETDPIGSTLDADVVVMTTHQLCTSVCQFIPETARTVIINITITREQFRKVAEIPAGTSVLLVNDNPEMTLDLLSQFFQFGLNHLQFVPYYPGITNDPKIDIAVTPDESAHVPPFVKHVLDIGDRVLDAQTLIEIATALDLEHILHQEAYLQYVKNICPSSGGIISQFDRANVLESQLSSLQDLLEEGLVIIDASGKTRACNRKAREVLKAESTLVGVPITDVIPKIRFSDVLERAQEVDYTLVRVHSRNISVKVVPVQANGEVRGALAIVNTFDEKEKSQQHLRAQLLGKGHRSRYNFEDILTACPAMQEVKDLAQKKALSDASVLIIGETGTGKELFAHAIHNASRRKEQQFVTVNCAALPESLLESELFGYEEGAFTSARKGGKPGFFELSHRGTLFLDEIGEMDMNLQTRLLRVLENREVMRIGGDRMISVDIRIIAATNKDLWAQVEQGKFRKDLYYRLNVLPIEVPPLRERREDVLLILEHFMKIRSLRFTLSPETVRVLMDYHWPGNIRELKNVFDYLTHLDKDQIDARDLTPILRRAALGRMREGPDEPAAGSLSSLGVDAEECRFLLGCLHASHKQKVRSGRHKLHLQALEQDLFLTEAQIRKLLEKMERAGLVKLSAGRGGTKITPLGIETYRRLESA
ncbi:MAG TPA: sigma 54-interacting transcriptional regulator [Holophaga sp.]|nr:sigma 54-interacting transcriptional regulator [Holophaga sp.]